MRRDTLKKVMLGALFVAVGLLAMVTSAPESSAFEGRVQHASRASFGGMPEGASASSFAAPAMAMADAVPMPAAAPMMMKRSAPMASGGGGAGVAGMSDMAGGMDSLRQQSDTGGSDAPLFGQPVILKEAYVTGEVQVRWRIVWRRTSAGSAPMWPLVA